MKQCFEVGLKCCHVFQNEGVWRLHLNEAQHIVQHLPAKVPQAQLLSILSKGITWESCGIQRQALLQVQ